MPAAAPSQTDIPETTLTRLANWTTAINASDLGPGLFEPAKLLLLDTIGCALAGWHEESARGVIDMITAQCCAPECQIIGSTSRTSGTNAVLANGMLGRVLDLNDYVANDPAEGGELGGHPSDNISVALAAGEAGGSSGRALLAAIIIGYEIFDRATALIERRSAWDRSSASGIVAPVIAGKLLGLDSMRIAHALALSIARCATSAMVRSGDISSAKSIANPLVAQNGYQATLLAARGLTGPLAVLEHPAGMKALFDAEHRLAEMDAPFPERPYITRARIKAFPSVATSQSLAAAAIALHAKVKDRLDDIRSISIAMVDYGVIRRHQSEPVRRLPNSREAADHSFPFVAVVGVLDGAVGFAQYDNERWMEPRTRKLIENITMTTDPSLNTRSKGGYPARVEVTMNDGTIYAHEVLDPPGGADGLDSREVIAKFERTTEGMIPRDRAARIVDVVMGLDQTGSCGDLAKALAWPVRI